MNFSLLDKITTIDRGLLATVVKTEGHTYKKKGEKALFAVDDPFPVYGNLGSLCVDQEIVSEGRRAFAEGKPRLIEVDTSDTTDIHFGYGTYCGGKMEILLEPLSEAHKTVYEKVRAHLRADKPFYLTHDLETGQVRVTVTAPKRRGHVFVESFSPFTKLFLFGATPLAQAIISTLGDMEFRIHVIDWRSDYLERFVDVDTILADRDPLPFDEQSFVLILSHGFERDRDALKQALSCRCAYIGVLSSKARRDKMYEELARDGVSEDRIGKVSSPVGIDIGGRSDIEIAIGIVAEIVRAKNQ